MRRLDEAEREVLREQIVLFVLAVRREYLRSPGVNVLKHWDQIRDRMRSAARRAESVADWATLVLRGLNLPSPRSDLSSILVGLTEHVRRADALAEMLDLVEREHGLILALARLRADDAREARALGLDDGDAADAAREREGR